jgi:hypothetical protein
VGLWVFLTLNTLYLTDLRVKDEISGAVRYSDILLKWWKVYGRHRFGISKFAVA